MSHEGIRFVDERQARRIDEEENFSELPPEATQPAHVRVNLTTGEGMEIEWKDGHKSRWTFRWLRDACPCAVCHQARELSGRLPGEPEPKPQELLPMFKPALRLESAEPIGRYAIGFHWNDGHKTGIYSWVYLRRHCQCPACRPTHRQQ